MTPDCDLSIRRLVLGGLGVLSCGLSLVAADTQPTLVPSELFAVPEGLEVTVWASSPMLRNPTNMDVDKDGNVWIAEGVNYRRNIGRSAEGDKIVVLRDTDGDGKADKVHTFVQEKMLIAPLGVAVLDNKIVVSQNPDLIVYTDVNRNLVFDPGVDKREVLLTGFNGQNHDHSLHSVTAGPDGQWYWNSGNCGALFTDRSGKTFRVGSPYNPGVIGAEHGVTSLFNPTEIAGKPSDDGHVYVGGFTARMNPDGTQVHIIGQNYRNSYEQTVTSFGDVFQNDNDDPPACRVSFVMEYGNAGFASFDGKRSWRADQRPGQTTAVAEWRQDDPGTMPVGDVYGGGSPTGVAFYENGALGKDWEGLLLSCEAGRNVVFGYKPRLQGAGFALERFDFLTSNKEKQFAGSDFLGGNNSVTSELKTLFRPSDVTVGPDGAIYVADWFDARVGGHAALDESASGAIYRIAPKGFKPRVPKLDLETLQGQIQALQSPAVNVRNSGFTRLVARGEAAVDAVAALLKHDNRFIAARAVWVLSQQGPKGLAKVEKLLKSADESVRIVAYRALRRQNHRFLETATRMASDPSPAVRREVALSMRDVNFRDSRPILTALAKQYDGSDRSYLEALGTGCTKKEKAMFRALQQAIGGSPLSWSPAFARIAWRLGAVESIPALKERALSPSLPAPERKLMMDALAFIKAPAAAQAMIDIAASAEFPYKAEAIWWLMHRMNNDWESYQVREALKKSGIYDPANVTLVPIEVPAPEPPAQPFPPVEEMLKLKPDAARGREIVSSCYMCHRIGSQGVDFGPDLTAFGKTQTREVLIKAIMDPSADISHGYEGSEILTKDDVRIHGIILSQGDPVIIKSMAGTTQTVPKNRIKKVSKLNRSLMFSAYQLGMQPQDLIDVIGYLQSDLVR